MDTDDTPTGRVLTRREVLALIGAGGLGMSGLGVWGLGSLGGDGILETRSGQAAATGPTLQLPSCVVRPEQTEGPYFVDEKLNRSDVRSDPATGVVRPGVPLDLSFRVSRVGTGSCTPLAAALVDLWQCDALGVYSDVRDMNGLFDTRGQKFLRGHQLTDAAGGARFQTIYPGWYEGRTVHLHFKIRVPAQGTSYHDFTSQLYFDDALSDAVFARAPYATKGARDTRNSGDGIYRRGGASLLLDAKAASEGYAATFHIGLQL